MKTLSIIIPIYNEEATLQELVEKVINLDLSFIWYNKEIILINDWSNDKSEEIIQTKILKQSKKDYEIKYIKNPRNSWKWYSLKIWFKNATWEVMIVQDADLEYFPEKDYVPMLKAYEEKNVDFVYWSRILGTKLFGNNYSTKAFKIWWLLVSRFTTLLSLKRVTDESTCYKMYDKKLKKYLVLPPENWFEREPAVTMLLLRNKYKYIEVPIHYHARAFKEWKKIKRQDWVKAILTLIKWRFKNISNLI